MITEEQFLEAIKAKTGKEIGKDYGFVLGTQTPYADMRPRGVFSSGNHQGFKVWKRIGKDYDSTILNPKDSEEALKQIIEFLNTDYVIG